MKDINDKIALRATNLLGNIWTGYFFAALSLVSFPAVITSGNIVVIISWFSQSFIQLVALSILQKGQNLQSEESQAKLDVILNKLLKDEEEILTKEELLLNENTTSHPKL